MDVWCTFIQKTTERIWTEINIPRETFSISVLRSRRQQQVVMCRYKVITV